MKDIELYWLAGVLEGEGSFMLSRNHVSGKTYLYPKITVAMTDKDIIDRVSSLLGTTTYIIPNTKENRKPQFRASLTGMRAASLMAKLLPIMGKRRANKIQEIVSAYGEIEPTEIRRSRACSVAQKARWAQHGTREGKLNE